MYKTEIVLALASALCITPVLAQDTDSSANAGKQFISSSIASDTTVTPDGAIDLYMFPGWFKPRCARTSYKGCNRLVLKVSKGKAILNPSGYKDLVDLKNLRIEDATMLWGEPRGDADVKTFDLLSEMRTVEKDIYHLDVRFKEGVLESYRIRGIGIHFPSWQRPKGS